MPLFNFTACRFWTSPLIFTIILLFIIPIPVMMTISARNLITADALINLKVTFARDWPLDVRYFIIFAMSIFAVVTSCSRFKYLKSKVSVDFYHSLPIKRGRLFATQLAVGAMSLILPYLFNMLLTLLIFAVNGFITQTLILNVLAISIDTLAYTLLYFSLSTLVGMVSGLTSMHLSLSVIVVFLPPLMYAVTILFISLFNHRMWVDYYFSSGIVEKLSPAIRFFMNGSLLSPIELIVTALLSAAMLAGAYVIYAHRKSERSGTPVVFKPLGEVIKYIIMFFGAICGGLLFSFIMNDLAWTVFGILSGTVLSFMLANSVLNKTARAMFKGWKGLCVFTVIVMMFFTLLAVNAFGINDHVPSPTFTSKIEVNFENNGGTMEFGDKEVIRALHSIYEKGANAGWENTKLHGDALRREEKRIEIVFYPKFGIPNAKQIYINNQEQLIDELRTLLDSEEFAAQYKDALLNIPGNGNVYIDLPGIILSPNGKQLFHTSKGVTNVRFNDDKPIDSLKEEIGIHMIGKDLENVNFDFFQTQSYGFIQAYGYTHDYKEFYQPAFVSMTNSTNFWKANGNIFHTPDEMREIIAEHTDSIKITGYTKAGEGKTMVITDKKQMLEVLTSTTSLFSYYKSPFTLTDMRFYVEYDLEVSDIYDGSYYYDDEGNRHEIYEYTDNSSSNTIELFNETTFLYGKVPEFVLEYFE